jgi:hypothetical protein
MSHLEVLGIMNIKFLFVFFAILLSLMLFGCQQKNVTSEEAIKRGDIVNVHGEITHLEKFNQFLQNVHDGIKDKVRITSYTTEGDPIFYDLDYNGKKVNYTYDDSQDSYGGSGVQSTSCSDIVSSNVENGVEYNLSNCSSDVGNTFYFRVPE